jgi:low affinity Fe/Cu permease
MIVVYFGPAAFGAGASRVATMAEKRSIGPGASTRGVLMPDHKKGRRDHFGTLATEVARLTGAPLAFMSISTFILLWALGGLYFHFSEVWLLFINTVCTIVTTLVVFLIQNTQNRDTLALQLKLAELILVMEGAEPKMALAEDLSHEDLEALKEKLRERTQEGE